MGAIWVGIMGWNYHEHIHDDTIHFIWIVTIEIFDYPFHCSEGSFFTVFFSFLSLNENFGGFWRKIDFKISFWSDLKNFSIFNWKIIDIEMGKALPNKRMAKIFTLPWRVRFWNNYRIRTQLLSQTVAMTPSRSCDRFYEAFMKDMKFSFLS